MNAWPGPGRRPAGRRAWYEHKGRVRSMANCREIEERLAAYVDGEVAAPDRSTIDAHLERCPPCRTRAAAERATHELLLARQDRLRGCAPEALRRRCAAQRTLRSEERRVGKEARS